MAKTLFRSPGVSTREIDLSAPGQITPQGIPAGVVGTSKTGPAFVPTVFATANEFTNIFGDSEAKYFGPIAVKEWMRNARSGLFLRVLGVGNAKEANDSGVTARAGFFVGDKIRNQSSTAAESDGSAMTRSVNPYAGSSLPSRTSRTENEAGALQANGTQEVFDITLGGAGNGTDVPTQSEIDGHYIILEATASGADGAHSVGVKHLYWFDWQSSRTVSGQTIKDGEYTIANLAATGVLNADIILVPIATGDDYNDIAATLRTLIQANQAGISAVSGNVVTITQLGAIAGSFSGDITTAKAYDRSESTPGVNSAVLSSTTTVVANAEGIDSDVDIAFSTTVTELPYDGTSVVITEKDGGVTTITIGSGNSFTIDTTVDTTTTAVATRLTSLAGALGDVTATRTNQSVNIVVAHGDNDNGDTLTSVAMNETAPGAPGGRVMFLGAKMFAKDESVDLFGRTRAVIDNDAASYAGTNVLRGVLMFASGVMPGLAVANGNTWETATASSVAFGSYTAGDEGSHTGYLKDDKFIMILNGFNETASGNSAYVTGSFDPESPIYLSKVFNTDPTKLQERGHYLYAHYDVPSGLARLPAAAGNYCFLDSGAYNPHTESASDLDAGLDSGTAAYKPSFENWRQKFSHAFSPWITSQKLGNTRKKLFRFHMLDAGAGGHNKVKISVANISKSTDSSSSYGSFDIQIRAASDTDKDPIILEQHVGLSLNPSSDKYIARVIGDQNTFFEFEKAEGKQKLVTEGLYANRSLYVRVEVVDQIESGQMEASALPVGFQGKHHLVLGGDALANVSGGLVEPPLPFRASVSTGTGSRLSVDPAFYWGSQSQNVRSASERNKEAKIVSLVSNLTKWFPHVGSHKAWVGDNANAVDLNGEGQDANDYNENEFSLEKVWVQCKKNSSGVPDTSLAVDPTQWREAVYIRDGNEDGYKPFSSSALDSNQSTTTDYYQAQEIVNENALAGSKKSKSSDNGWRYLDVSKDFGENASKKYFKFTLPIQGGWDGLDIFDKDKSEMNNMSAFREMSSNTSGDLGGAQGPTTAGFRKAIDILAEKSDVDIQVLATPGMRSAGVTDYAIDKTEDRFDALYIMDMMSIDNDLNIVKSTSQYTNVTNTVNDFSGRNLDSSFAAAYFPDLVIQDGEFNVVVPPSVGVIGALSLNDAVSHPWYAPAGQARGALSTVIETAVKLNRSNMDVLYEGDINPITSFPNQGDSVMIYGQKTLLQAQSSLDRVNVRRLLIDIRRKVRNVANSILFEPNREATLARFSSLVNPILGRIQQQNGLDRFKVVIDTTTTTQQDVENNTIRGKIFLQPTRSIEFISLDFVVTNTGAEI